MSCDGLLKDGFFFVVFLHNVYIHTCPACVAQLLSYCAGTEAHIQLVKSAFVWITNKSILLCFWLGELSDVIHVFCGTR